MPLAVHCSMDSPDDYRMMASDLRKLAAESGALARRAKLFILAEQFEELANDFELELAHRFDLTQSITGNS